MTLLILANDMTNVKRNSPQKNLYKFISVVISQNFKRCRKPLKNVKEKGNE
jgi:hypothetical protein